jgi:hypothetical protein
LRQRIPWSNRYEYLNGEEVELESFAEEGLAEVTTDAIAETSFIGIEEAAAGLDATGVGAPIGFIVGGLAALGFGAYEIYEHLIKKHPDITLQTVREHHPEHNSEPTAIIPLEEQGRDADFVPLENQAESSERGFVPPPFKYLGPGNSLNRGPPYNKVDEDARQHDIQYSQATNKEHIFESDRQFLNKAYKHITDGISGKGTISDTIGGVIGYGGIGVKHLAEKIRGDTIYPSFSGKKWHLHLKKNLKNIKIMVKNGLTTLLKRILICLKVQLNRVRVNVLTTLQRRLLQPNYEEWNNHNRQKLLKAIFKQTIYRKLWDLLELVLSKQKVVEVVEVLLVKANQFIT